MKGIVWCSDREVFPTVFARGLRRDFRYWYEEKSGLLMQGVEEVPQNFLARSNQPASYYYIREGLSGGFCSQSQVQKSASEGHHDGVTQPPYALIHCFTAVQMSELRTARCKPKLHGDDYMRQYKYALLSLCRASANPYLNISHKMILLICTVQGTNEGVFLQVYVGLQLEQALVQPFHGTAHSDSARQHVKLPIMHWRSDLLIDRNDTILLLLPMRS